MLETKFNRLKREALSEALEQYFAEDRISKNKRDLIESAFVRKFETRDVTEVDISEFCADYELSKDTLINLWHNDMISSLDPYIKEYLKWIDTEKKIQLSQELLHKELTIKTLEQDRNFIDYINLDIQNDIENK